MSTIEELRSLLAAKDVQINRLEKSKQRLYKRLLEINSKISRLEGRLLELQHPGHQMGQ